jgi:hypothetical protein
MRFRETEEAWIRRLVEEGERDQFGESGPQARARWSRASYCDDSAEKITKRFIDNGLPAKKISIPEIQERLELLPPGTRSYIHQASVAVVRDRRRYLADVTPRQFLSLDGRTFDGSGQSAETPTIVRLFEEGVIPLTDETFSEYLACLRTPSRGRRAFGIPPRRIEVIKGIVEEAIKRKLLP